MRVLVVDPDTGLLGHVRRGLEVAGHQVRVAASAEAFDIALSAGGIDLVLLDVDLAVAARPVSERLRAAGTHVVLSTSRSDGDPGVQRLRAWFGKAGFLRKPFSVLDLPYLLADAVQRGQAPPRASGGEFLGRLVARGADGPARASRPPVSRANRSLVPRSGGPVVFPVAERLANVWAERFTGVLHVQAQQAAIGRPVQFKNGGLVDPRDVSIIEVALRGAELRFAVEPVPASEGDRASLFQALWAAVYSPREARFGEVHAFEALDIGNRSTLDELLSLVSDATRRVLQSADGARALGEVIVHALTTPAEVSGELQALHRLGLVRLAPPSVGPRNRRRTRRTDAAGDSRPPTSSSRRTSARKPKKTRSSSRRTSASFADRPTSSGGSSGRRSGRARVAERMRRAGRSDAVHKRLEMEINRLTGATPAEVLGVPHDAATALVRQVSQRMLDRYQQIAEEESYPEATRALAAKLVERVSEARAAWGHSTKRAAADPTTAREQVMLEQAKVLLEAHAFARADRVLVKARELAMANPGILAALGWARFHNPEKQKGEREEEGRDYLLLAEQFDPRDTEVLWQVAQVLDKMGNVDGARARADRIVSIDPSDKAAAAMARRLAPDESED